MSLALGFWLCSLRGLEAAFCWLTAGNPVPEGRAERPGERQHPQRVESGGSGEAHMRLWASGAQFCLGHRWGGYVSPGQD